MQARKLEERLKGLRPGSALAIRTSLLRDESLMPRGGRGVGAPKLMPRDVAAILAAFEPDKTVEAAAAAKAYLGLRSTERGITLWDALEQILGAPSEALAVRAVRFCRAPEPFAEIERADRPAEPERFFAPSQVAAGFDPAKTFTSRPQKQIVFPTGLLHQIAIDLRAAERAVRGAEWEEDGEANVEAL